MPGDLEVASGTGDLDQQLFQGPVKEAGPANRHRAVAPLELHEMTGGLEIRATKLEEDPRNRFQAKPESYTPHDVSPRNWRLDGSLFIRRTFRSINGIGAGPFRRRPGPSPLGGGMAWMGKEELLSYVDTIE